MARNTVEKSAVGIVWRTISCSSSRAHACRSWAARTALTASVTGLGRGTARVYEGLAPPSWASHLCNNVVELPGRGEEDPMFRRIVVSVAALVAIAACSGAGTPA